MLKSVPNKNAGFIILLTSIFILFLFGEIRNLTTFLLSINNPSYLSLKYSFFILIISFIWIGPQFPQDNFISFTRILTLYYYFLLICILLTSSYKYFGELLNQEPRILRAVRRRVTLQEMNVDNFQGQRF